MSFITVYVFGFPGVCEGSQRVPGLSEGPREDCGDD